MINPEDIKIETIVIPPKGGQQCGIAQRGVRVIHLPTGLVASCECERSQMRNKDIALAMLEWGMEELGVGAL